MGVAGKICGYSDILVSGEVVNEIVKLKYEANIFSPVIGQLLL